MSNGLGAGDADGSVAPLLPTIHFGLLVRAIARCPRFDWRNGRTALLDSFASGLMSKNPVLDVPLSAVMRPEIALPLQHVLQIYSVGSLLKAWRSPKNHRSIEQVFDSPEQARNAVAVCAAWLGIQTMASHEPVPAWWPGDERVQISA